MQIAFKKEKWKKKVLMTMQETTPYIRNDVQRLWIF